MPSLSVSVGAYGSLDAAVADWENLELEAAVGVVDLVDAAMIERTDDRIAAFRRQSANGWAGGAIASALVGVLWPPALLVGAIAGGVGAQMITVLSRSLSRDAVNELARVMTAGRFVTVVITERSERLTSMAVGARSLRIATLPLEATGLELGRALDVDRAEQ